MPKKSEPSTTKRTKDLRKQIKIFLLIISIAIILFSEKLYAQALRFIAYGEECDISQIPLDGFYCLGIIPAYHFLDITAHTDDNNLILKCRALGLRYDLTKGIPDDSVETHFVKDRLELTDDFTLNWKK